MTEGSPKSPCRLQRPLRRLKQKVVEKVGRLKNKVVGKVDDLKREYGCREYDRLLDDDSVSTAPPSNAYYAPEGLPVPAPPTIYQPNGLEGYPVPGLPTSFHNGLGEFPTPAPPMISHYGYGEFPVPTSPYGWWPAGQNDHEASGSNHPSHQNSDYIDTENWDVPPHLRDPQIPDHGDPWKSRTLSEQVAGLFDDLHVSTPTGRAPPPPSVSFDTGEFPPTNTVSPEQPRQEPFFPGALSVEEMLQECESSSMEQSRQTAVTGHTPSSSVHPGSMMTGNTVTSYESLMDTGSSGCVLSSVPQDRPSSGHFFHDIYWDNRRIVRGEAGPGRSSGRRGRDFRVLTHIACTLIRNVRKVRGKCRRVRKRSLLYICYYRTSPTTGLGRYHLGSPSAGAVQSQNSRSVKVPCPKKLRTEGPGAQPQEQCNNHGSRYKGVKRRNAKWKVEIRVSMTVAVKVWMAYDEEVDAALAYDAGMYHCSKKRKDYNFPTLSTPHNLGKTHYDDVLAHCKNGRLEDAKQLVKSLADRHIANYKAKAIALPASASCSTPSCF